MLGCGPSEAAGAGGHGAGHLRSPNQMARPLDLGTPGFDPAPGCSPATRAWPRMWSGAGPGSGRQGAGRRGLGRCQPGVCAPGSPPPADSPAGAIESQDRARATCRMWELCAQAVGAPGRLGFALDPDAQVAARGRTPGCLDARQGAALCGSGPSCFLAGCRASAAAADAAGRAGPGRLGAGRPRRHGAAGKPGRTVSRA